MKIGVDARMLCRPLTGIGRYTLEMCCSLSSNSNVSLYLYSPNAIREDMLLGIEKTTLKTKRWDNAFLWQIWFESYLPLWANIDNVDIFWGPAHRLPRLLPNNMLRVVTIHDLVWKYAGETMRPLSRIFGRCQMPFSLRAANEIITDSQATADAIRDEYSIDSRKLTVIPLGTKLSLDVAPFKSLKHLHIKQPYIFFVGTIEPRKNLANLLSAYARLPDSVMKETMLVIAGGKGWGGVNLQDAISRLGIGKQVRLLGYVEDPILATLYANALFLAMPSLYEGFGLPLVEAMAYGTPVLTANNSSMPEIARDAGILVDAQDVRSISNGLEQLITNRELRDRLARNAKRNASRFNWDKSAKQLHALFERAISDKNSHP